MESNLVHLVLWPPIGLLCQPWVIMMMKLVEWVARETEVFGKNMPQSHFVHHKPHMLCSDANPCHCGGKPATNRLSYGTAPTCVLTSRQLSCNSCPQLTHSPISCLYNLRMSCIEKTIPTFPLLLWYAFIEQLPSSRQFFWLHQSAF
jgi:hypothetical protein